YGQSGVTAFDVDNASERAEAVARTIGASLVALRDDTGLAAQRYEALAVLPDHVWVPFDVLADLWAIGDAKSARRVAQKFGNVAVLDLHFEHGIQVHDVFLEYLRHRAADLAACHRRLLDAWGDPHRLSYEYAWHWFGWHSVAANECGRLRALLLDLDWLDALIH